jgi:hypothetical protein
MDKSHSTNLRDTLLFINNQRAADRELITPSPPRSKSLVEYLHSQHIGVNPVLHQHINQKRLLQDISRELNLAWPSVITGQRLQYTVYVTRQTAPGGKVYQHISTGVVDHYRGLEPALRVLEHFPVPDLHHANIILNEIWISCCAAAAVLPTEPIIHGTTSTNQLREDIARWLHAIPDPLDFGWEAGLHPPTSSPDKRPQSLPGRQLTAEDL